MVEPAGTNIIRLMLQKWRLVNMLADFLMSLAIACITTVLLFKVPVLPVYYGVFVLVFCFFLLVFIHGYWKITEADLVRFLNRMFPEMEESSNLLLKPYDSLNMLEKMQASKIRQVIHRLPQPVKWNNRFRFAWIMLLLTMITCTIIVILPYSFRLNNPGQEAAIKLPGKTAAVTERKPASVQSVSIRIVPPAYTGKSPREQNEFNLLVEENAGLRWTVVTTTYVKDLRFIFNDSSILSLKAVDTGHTQWTGSRLIRQTGFYQVKTGNSLSEFYKIETVKDLPPAIKIQSPKPYVVIDYGQPQKVQLNVSLSDDYGIDSAGIVATIASGSGEGVKFREQQFSFPGFSRGRKQYQLKRLMDLPSLGLAPGDELYYYVKARDNHGQENRSDIYIITLPDTASLMSMEGMTGGVNLVPEYFRSQRQIIIETEQLIKEKDTVSTEQFNNRSNNLGIDQKLLRLRYGKFLGEESENEIGAEEGHDDHDHHDEKPHNEAGESGNAAAIMDAYSHKHDNAEDATFFEPELKAQLKATLNEMWKSELQLRTYKPREALPFEYKALRLLKDLQQKSRVYVAKTGVKTTPLKRENRLTGELDKITEPAFSTIQSRKPGAMQPVIMAIPVMEKLRGGYPLQTGEREILKRAATVLTISGSKNPSVFLAPLAAMRRILNSLEDPGKVQPSDIALVENAFQKILPPVHRLPAATGTYQATDLSRQYFRNLNRWRQ